MSSMDESTGFDAAFSHLLTRRMSEHYVHCGVQMCPLCDFYDDTLRRHVDKTHGPQERRKRLLAAFEVVTPPSGATWTTPPVREPQITPPAMKPAVLKGRANDIAFNAGRVDARYGEVWLARCPECQDWFNPIAGITVAPRTSKFLHCSQECNMLRLRRDSKERVERDLERLARERALKEAEGTDVALKHMRESQSELRGGRKR